MLHTIHRLKEFLSYQQRAQTKYYIHSPFVYQFYLNVLEGKTGDTRPILSLHQKLQLNYDKISVDDKGAAPGIKEKRISDMARKASIPHKYGKILYYIAQYFAPASIIELGTCLGIGTAYMAAGAPAARITTIEGSEALARVAAHTFSSLKFNHIDLLKGDFDTVLPDLLTKTERVDMAFIDGNHRYEPTMKYFNLLMTKTHDKSILIFDDIYWSPEMTDAWTAIKADPRITLTVDIYRLGIAFMNHDKLAKEDFTLRY
jgi:predicted O-methyltransferase YrrM